MLNGIATVRAFGAQERYLEVLHRRLDATQSCNNLFWMANRWLMLRYDLMGAFTVFGASVLALLGGIDAGLAGIAITQAQNFVLAMYWLCRCWTGFEMDLNSVERMHEYLSLPQEPPAIIQENRPPANWPSKIDSRGIQVKNLVLKYAPDLDPVLRGVDFNIIAVKRWDWSAETGSGKSTLALAFFRFVEYEQGSIVIDGIDISKIGLEDLRGKLTIIPQDPVLFTGTIRDNLDPFTEHSDEECLLALRRVNLRTSPVNTAAPSVLPSRAGSVSRKPHRDQRIVFLLDCSSICESSRTWCNWLHLHARHESLGRRQQLLTRSTSAHFDGQSVAAIHFDHLHGRSDGIS